MHPKFRDAIGEPAITSLLEASRKPRASELERAGFGHYVIDVIANNRAEPARSQ